MAESVVEEALAQPVRVAVADAYWHNGVLGETIGRARGGQCCGRDRGVLVEHDHAEVMQVGTVVTECRIGDRGAMNRRPGSGIQLVAEDDVGAARCESMVRAVACGQEHTRRDEYTGALRNEPV